MKTIHKYTIDGDTFLKMPKNAKILKIDKQENDICLWAIVDASADNPVEERYFIRYATGWQISDSTNLEYIDTVSDNVFVWHWFEVKG